MHELTITQQILNIAVAEAQKAQAEAIKQISLVIGDLSSVVDDSVQFYFDFLSKDTLAEGAQLSFNRIHLKIRCRRCNHVFAPAAESWLCPECQNRDVEIIAGTEFYVDSIEVE